MTTVGAMVATGALSKESQQALLEGQQALRGGGSWIGELGYLLQEAAAPIIRANRDQEIATRMEQLTSIIEDANKGDSPVAKAALASLERRVARAGDVDSSGKAVSTIQDRLGVLQLEREAIAEKTAKEGPHSLLNQADYETLLLRTASGVVYNSLIAAVDSRVSEAGSGGRLSHDLGIAFLTNQAASKGGEVEQDLQTLVSGSAFVSVCFADTLLPALESSRTTLAALADENPELAKKLDFSAAVGTAEELRVREWACLQASYGVAAIPDLILNFFRNVDSNPEFWPPTYDIEAEAAQLAEAAEAAAEPVEKKEEPVMYENFFSAKSIAAANSRHRDPQVQDYNAS